MLQLCSLSKCMTSGQQLPLATCASHMLPPPSQVAGHGNFGSLDNDPAAAMRYTECRLQAVSSAVLLADLEYDTVDFAPNFDGSQVHPLSLANVATGPAFLAVPDMCISVFRSPSKAQNGLRQCP